MAKDEGGGRRPEKDSGPTADGGRQRHQERRISDHSESGRLADHVLAGSVMGDN